MKNICLLLLSVLIFSCSSNKQVNDESPYAIQIKEVRSIYKAEDVVKRLEKFDVNSYIIAEEGDDGTWYRIISGAENSLDKIQKHKDWLDEKADFKELKIINYQNIKSNLVEDYKESNKEQERIKTLKPDVPEKIYDIISKFPDDDNFIVENFFIVNCPDSIKDIRKFREGYNVDHDLPRGVSMKSLMKKSECIAEVIYEDNLFEDRVTIDIVKLKKNHGIEIDNIEYSSVINSGKDINPRAIANYFAELILETGKYSFEDKVKIDISSYQKFFGYKVTIKPSKRKDEYRTYFVLVSKDMSHVVFSQSTQKTEDEIIDIIKSLGKGEGLNSYDEFYNSFYTLPSKIKHEFICFTTEKLSRRYARERNNAKWAKKMVGHWNSTAHFYSEEHRGYMVSFFDLLYEDQVDYIYKTLYIDAQSSSRSSFEIDVKGKTGITFKGTYPTEVSFPSGRNVIVTANGQSGKLKLADMLGVCESMQLTSE